MAEKFAYGLGLALGLTAFFGAALRRLRPERPLFDLEQDALRCAALNRSIAAIAAAGVDSARRPRVESRPDRVISRPTVH